LAAASSFNHAFVAWDGSISLKDAVAASVAGIFFDSYAPLPRNGTDIDDAGDPEVEDEADMECMPDVMRTRERNRTVRRGVGVSPTSPWTSPGDSTSIVNGWEDELEGIG